MEELVTLMLDAGRSGLDMALYILMPIMVIMLAIMKLLDAKGVLSWVANKLAPVSRVFGIPGLGIFAMIKLLSVGFAAPIATLALMENNHTSQRYIASTLAMLLTMSQANASFPLTALGLNLSITLLTSLIAGLIAGAFTYYILCRDFKDDPICENTVADETSEKKNQSIVQILADGGQEGLKIVLHMIPMLILALFVVNVLKVTGAIELISQTLTVPFALFGLSEATILPIVTKFIAGGTAFTGVTIDLMNQGLISPTELNRMAGFTMNSLDLVGVAIFASVGIRTGGVIRYSVYGACFGLLIRGVLHLIIF